MLLKSEGKGFCTLDDILYEDENQEYQILQQIPNVDDKLKRICDVRFEMDQHFYRISQEKLTKWLHSKIEKILNRMNDLAALKDYQSSNQGFFQVLIC